MIWEFTRSRREEKKLCSLFSFNSRFKRWRGREKRARYTSIEEKRIETCLIILTDITSTSPGRELRWLSIKLHNEPLNRLTTLGNLAIDCLTSRDTIPVFSETGKNCDFSVLLASSDALRVFFLLHLIYYQEAGARAKIDSGFIFMGKCFDKPERRENPSRPSEKSVI
jgi:hypothetical protein